MFMDDMSKGVMIAVDSDPWNCAIDGTGDFMDKIPFFGNLRARNSKGISCGDFRVDEIARDEHCACLCGPIREGSLYKGLEVLLCNAGIIVVYMQV